MADVAESLPQDPPSDDRPPRQDSGSNQPPQPFSASQGAWRVDAPAPEAAPHEQTRPDAAQLGGARSNDGTPPLAHDLPPSGGRRTHYCVNCGEIFDAKYNVCPNCDTWWVAPSSLNVPALATVLTELQGLHDQGLITDASYQVLRQVYERRLSVVRPGRRRDAASIAGRTTTAVDATPPVSLTAPSTRLPAGDATPSAAQASIVFPHEGAAGTPVPGTSLQRTTLVARSLSRQEMDPQRYVSEPPEQRQEPVRPITEVLAEWTAARQADIVLYLGAFLVSIAALIFTGYQGAALGGPGRFALMAAYTAAFLTGGLLLPRWERVREAGAVFLVVGALMFPLCWAMVRTQLLGKGAISYETTVLSGSVATALLYGVLAWRGYGRFYEIPARIAAAVAWFAAGRVLDFPYHRQAAWVLLGGFTCYALFCYLPLRWPALTRALAVAVGVLALVVLSLYLIESGPDERLFSALGWLLALAWVGFARYQNRSWLSLAALPGTLALTALAVWLAAVQPQQYGWVALFVLLAAAGYAVASQWDQPANEVEWGVAVGSLAGLALWIGLDGAQQARPVLPLTAGLTLALAAAVWVRLGWAKARFAVPALVSVFVAALIWFVNGELDVAWVGCFFLLAAAGYALVASYDRELEPLWSVMTSGLTVIALASALSLSRVTPLALPVTVGLALALAAGVWARNGWSVARFAVPSLAAAAAAALLWYVARPPAEYLPVWLAVAALGYLVFASLFPEQRRSWRFTALGYGLAALLVVHFAAYLGSIDRPALLLVYLVSLFALVWDSLLRRDASLVLLILVAGCATVAGLWWQHVTIVWWSYPLLAALLLLVALRGRLPLTPQAHSHLNTNTVAALAILPLVWVRLHLDLPWHGLTVAAVVALGLLYARRSAAARCLPAPALPPGSAAVPDQPPGESAGLPPLVDKPQDAATAIPFDAGVAAGHGQPAAAGGTLPLPAGRPGGQPAVLTEDVYAQRWWLLQGALAHGLMVAGYVNSVAALKGADRGWLFLAVALTAWAAMYALQRRRQPALEVTAPIVLTATLTALALTRVDDAAFALTLIGSAAGALVLYPVTCRVMSLLVPLTFAFAAMAAGRAALGLPEWTLAPAWAGVALALTARLTRWRRYSGSRLQEVEQAALALTMLPWVAALAAALLALRAMPAGQGRIQDTAQWLALTVVITLMGTVVTADGLRPAVRLRPLWTAGSAMLLLALLLAIGIWGPSNAIFYIAPAGAYLIGLGLTFRRSPPLFGDQMFGHEALHFAGSLLIGLTLLAQSFTGIGGSLSLQALLWGVLFLAAGFALTARWLVVGGVLLLTGVALRFLQEFSDQTPLWLWLGITGTLLLVAGFMLLFLREQWDRVRRAISRWWLTSAPRDGE